MLDHLRPVWAAPEQDRLFSDAWAAHFKFADPASPTLVLDPGVQYMLTPLRVWGGFDHGQQ